MEQQRSEQRRERRVRSKSEDRKSMSDVGQSAVNREADIKKDMGPSVSMTVVGENVEFTQHFHF
uniref:p7a n=1 Tax=Beet black scorch virus TaxID=196375 RepID=A3R4U9_9TOMB|nr:p7a [Beet black scorch virus]